MKQRQWWKEAVVYQIYPRSFCDSNGDGIGDLPGVIGKLDYLKELGVDALWLSPIYPSPNADNGYDISDYRGIMKEFGTMEDFDRLLEGAHGRGIRIVLDLVVNHTSDEHPWFLESKKGVEPYRDYYIWKKSEQGRPNRWEASFGGYAWEYVPERDSYYLHMFHKKQPDLNWENKAVRREVYDMMHFWLKKGVDGFRMDVINMISKAEGFPEGKPIPGTPFTDCRPFVMNGPRVHEFLKEMNREVLSHYDIMTVGETGFVNTDHAKAYTREENRELNMVFQFEHMDVENPGRNKWTPRRFRMKDLRDILFHWQRELAGEGWNSLYWNNHDQPRVVSRFGEEGRYRVLSAKMLATCLHFQKGTPYIYQGEELGMTNISYPLEDYRDVETLNAYDSMREAGESHEEAMAAIHARSRDNARTPMQWDDTEFAGFSRTTPWMRVNPNYGVINAKAALADKDSIFYYYKRLIALRHELRPRRCR